MNKKSRQLLTAGGKKSKVALEESSSHSVLHDFVANSVDIVIIIKTQTMDSVQLTCTDRGRRL